MKQILHNTSVWGQQQATNLLLLVYLMIGFLLLPDYGISMDEPIQRKHGIVSVEYVNQQLGVFPFITPDRNIDLQAYDHREYGVFFQMTAYLIERLCHLESAKDVFLLRHIMTFLLFWVGCYCFSQILVFRFQNSAIVFLGTLFLILSPRIFSQAFFNPKDIVFLSWTLVSLYTLTSFFHRPKWNILIFHALISSLAINARITGVFIPVWSIILMLGWYLFFVRTTISLRFLLSHLALYVIATLCFVILGWPFLWESPLQNFLFAFESMKQFAWNGKILFLGELISSTNVPWYYIPVWIIVTTPLLYLALGGIGFTTLIIRVIKKITRRIVDIDDLIDIAILGYWLIPLIAVIVLNSVLYNGWRHMFFIYPPMLIIAVHGLHFLWEKRTLNGNSSVISIRTKKWGLILLLVGSLGKVSWEMVQMHPFQQVYFNDLAGQGPHEKFDMEYFGLSYYQGLTYLFNTYSYDTLSVHVTSDAGKINQILFPITELDRLQFVGFQEADFLLTNYYFPANPHLRAVYFKDQPEMLFSIKYRNSPIIGLYSLSDSAESNLPIWIPKILPNDLSSEN